MWFLKTKTIQILYLVFPCRKQESQTDILLEKKETNNVECNFVHTEWELREAAYKRVTSKTSQEYIVYFLWYSKMNT